MLQKKKYKNIEQSWVKMALVSKPNQTESAHHVSKRLTMTSAGTGYSQMPLKEYVYIFNVD